MALIVIKKDGTGDYTTFSAALQAGGDTDIFETQDIGHETYDESFPQNINYGNVTIRSNHTDPALFPTIRFTGEYVQWWSNQDGLRLFQNVKMGNFLWYPTTTQNDRLIQVDKCWAIGNSVNAFNLADTVTPNRIKVTSSIFLNFSATIFKESGLKNNNVNLGAAYNCVFHGCSEVTDNSMSPGSNRFFKIVNSVFYQNGTNVSDADIRALWDYCYANNTADWGTGGVSGGGVDPFVNSGGVLPIDYKLNGTSTAKDSGTTVGAPTNDIGSQLFGDPINMGAWSGVGEVVPPEPEVPEEYRTLQYDDGTILTAEEIVKANEYVGRAVSQTLDNIVLTTNEGCPLTYP